MLTEKQLAEIEKLERAATPGPWTFEAGDFTGENWMIGSFLCGNSGIDGEDYHVTTDHVHGGELAGNSDAKTDAEFIAQSRSIVPALLHDIRRLRAVVEQYADRKNWRLLATYPVGEAWAWMPDEHGYTRAEECLREDGE